MAIIGDDISSCDLVDNKSHLYIYSLQTIPSERGKGHASRIIETCQRIAVLYGLPLELTAARFWNASNGICQTRLVLFYRRKGFEIIEKRGGGICRMRFQP